jgi:hypothetical protein
VLNPLRWRKVTWALDLWIAAFAIWMLAGIGSPDATCPAFNVAGDFCAPPGQIGGGQAVVFLIWCVGFVVLAFAWLMTSGRARVER